MNFPFPTDPRERMANKLIAQGHATADEIMHASFGEWPPKGLDIVGTNSQRIDIVNLWKFKNRFTQNRNRHLEEKDRTSPFKGFCENIKAIFNQLGSSDLFFARQIGINKIRDDWDIRVRHLNAMHFKRAFLTKTDMRVTILGHEATHILQGDNFLHASDIFGNKNAEKYIGDRKEIPARQIASDLFNRSGKKEVSKEEFYYSDGLEIQARLHEIVASGYQRWKKMPENKTEFLAAMRNCGFSFPSATEDKLVESPDFDAARAQFCIKRMQTSFSEDRAVKGIQMACSQLTEDGQKEFWDKTMPALYADLIEMYGDREGRARFGLGENPRAKIRESEEFLQRQKIHATHTPKPAFGNTTGPGAGTA